MGFSPNGFIENYIKAMNSHNVDAVVAFFTEDAAYEDAALAIVRRGRNELAEFVRFFFDCYHNVEYTPHSIVGNNDRIAWEWTLNCNYSKTSHTGIPANGQRISIRGSSFMTLENNRCKWNTDYWDIGTLRKQMES
jgi:steroid delta-isomerase-like uncharacterized protein